LFTGLLPTFPENANPFEGFCAN